MSGGSWWMAAGRGDEGSGTDFTLGAEEEFQIVDAETRDLRQNVERILAAAQDSLGDQVKSEFRPSMVETATRVCSSLRELRSELTRLRGELAAAAQREECHIAAGGTHPFAEAEQQGITDKERYRAIAEEYQQLAYEQLTFGCHVHVAISDRDLAVRTLDRTRPWHAVLRALGSNSPFWQGKDTAYDSYRTLLFDRWPVSGMPDPFGSEARYDEVIEDLEATETIPDPSFVEWDVRLSAHYETLEFRVMDACMTVDDAIMVAGLARSLTRTCHVQAVRGESPSQPRPELMSAARWRAARYGVEGNLIDLVGCRSVPATELIERFLDYLRPDLLEHGEWDELSQLVHRTLERGTGARRQREAMQRSGKLTAVVDLLVEQTMSGAS
ncbi:MAG: glutamate--cysteine ligase [Nitriliruptorales bacterium]